MATLEIAGLHQDILKLKRDLLGGMIVFGIVQVVLFAMVVKLLVV